MRALWTAAFHNPPLKRIQDLFSQDDYLVGGCVRDFLLGKPPADFDILTFGDVWTKALSIAGRLGAHAFWMDQERGIARIAVPDSAIKIDICAPKAPSIIEDLKLRDITINALALSAATGELFDPMSGQRDIEEHCIRIIAQQNLADDPLRGLRCLRFCLQLGFHIEEHTLHLLKSHAPDLARVSPERIKQELTVALSLPHGAELFPLLRTVGYLPVFFPQYVDLDQGIHHRWPLIEHVILCALEIDRLLARAEDLLPGSGEYFSEELEDGVPRAAMLRLAAFLHDIGKPSACFATDDGYLHFHGHAQTGAKITTGILTHLRFSSHAVRTAGGIVEHHMRILELAVSGNITQRAMHRFLKATSGFTPEILLLVIADAEATGKDPGYIGARPDIEAVAQRIWLYYRDVYSQQSLAPLLTGHDVMLALAIPSGPEIGRYLTQLEEARAEGMILTREEALAFLDKIRKASPIGHDMKNES